MVPTILLGLTSTSLLRFDSATPQAVTATPFTGVQSGDFIVSIDVRPSNGQLYGITNGEQLLAIDAVSGATTLIGTLTAAPGDPFVPFVGLTGIFGIDFDPTTDTIRLISDADENLVINPDTALVTTQTAISPSGENIQGVAYDNFAGAATTSLFGIGVTNDTLFRVTDPAGGILTPVGALGVDTSANAEFEIVGATGENFAVLTVNGIPGLYTLDLASGSATLIGTIGDGTVAVFGLTAPDLTAPAVISIDDGAADDAVPVGTTLTYTVTFSEDVRAGSFTADDLDNAGTAAVTIGTVARTAPGVFRVQVTPTRAGSLILRIRVQDRVCK